MRSRSTSLPPRGGIVITPDISRVAHPFAPLWNEASHTLVLGTFPSVKSRETGFYYGNPQNRFWRVLSAIFEEALPVSIQEKTAFLLRNGIAVWDVLDSCEIDGSSDQSIRAAVPNDLLSLLKASNIRSLYANGQKAGLLYRQLCESACSRPITILPSTSPANAAWTLQRLTESWSVLQKRG